MGNRRLRNLLNASPRSARGGPSGRARTRILQVGERRVIAEGLETSFWQDIHHHAMTASWPLFFAAFGGAFTFVNVVFALLYWLGHESIANARPGNILDLFFFSVETIGAVGYGEMHPQTTYGHVVATIEIFVGVCSLAVMAGLIFARFSRPRARLIFAQNPVIVSHDGAKTLMIRIANARHNSITDAIAKLWIVRDERTMEGSVFRRFHQLNLVRDENPVFALSWTIMHVLDEASPLHGWSEEDVASSDATFVITLNGLDETSSQFVHARQGYFAQDVVIDRDYADIIQVDDSGMMKIDYTKFHETKPVAAAELPGVAGKTSS